MNNDVSFASSHSTLNGDPTLHQVPNDGKSAELSKRPKSIPQASSSLEQIKNVNPEVVDVEATDSSNSMTAANKSRFDQNFNELQNVLASRSYTSKTIASFLSSMIEKEENLEKKEEALKIAMQQSAQQNKKNEELKWHIIHQQTNLDKRGKELETKQKFLEKNKDSSVMKQDEEIMLRKGMELMQKDLVDLKLMAAKKDEEVADQIQHLEAQHREKMIEKNSNYDDLKKKMKELETELSFLWQRAKTNDVAKLRLTHASELKKKDKDFKSKLVQQDNEIKKLSKRLELVSSKEKGIVSRSTNWNMSVIWKRN